MSTLNSHVSLSRIGAWSLLGVIAPVLTWMLVVYQKRYRALQEKEEKPFQTPQAEPLGVDPTTLSPIRYRPFRHGPNNITMAIRRLDWNNWLEMDENWLRYHDTKASELKKNFNAHVKYVKNAVTKDACFEVYEEVAAFVTHRYPDIFRWKDNNTIHNTLTKEDFPYPAKTPSEALASAALMVQDDLILMIENDDGQYHLDAAGVCLPGFWRLREKFRRSLDNLHFEAHVPHYGAKLQKPMNRFFKSLPPERPVVRNNFFIQLDGGLHWSYRMGDQDGREVASWATADSKGLTVDDIHFRTERQTLRRLPRSKALLFTVRTYLEPVTKISKEPFVPGRLAEAIRNWDDTVSLYKGKAHWEEILLPYLDAQDKKQRESGMLEKLEEPEFPY